jgi:hypothetical protein
MVADMDFSRRYNTIKQFRNLLINKIKIHQEQSNDASFDA